MLKLDLKFYGEVSSLQNSLEQDIKQQQKYLEVQFKSTKS